jgi:hypothetical protein
MATHYNQRAYKVTAADINSVVLYNVTMTRNIDVNGQFLFEGFHTTGGCGVAQQSGVLILLKDTINWTKICFKWEGTGISSCWSFMDTGGTNYGSETGTATGNLLTYSEGSGDRLHDNFLTWDVPAYQSHPRTIGCNNDANNFFRFNETSFKRFRMTRRRNVGTGFAGIHHGRSCNTTGSTAITRISEIFVW